MSDLATLAKALAGALLPALAGVLTTAATATGGPLAGALVGALLPQIAEALGLPADADAGVIAGRINSDRDAAAEKLAALEQSTLEFARLQMAQNAKEAESGSLFIAGWRPGFAWSVIFWMNYAFAAAVLKWPPLPPELFNPAWMVFGGIAGLRTVEKWQGVAREALKTAGTVLKPKAGR